LKRVREPDYPYTFDHALAVKPCKFAEMLPHVKGKWAKRNELLYLSGWQCFILCSLFGWVRKRDRLRRFRLAYLEIPRKNGKSVLAAVIGLYMFCMDGEHGAEVYSGATSEKQAWEVFRPAKAMLESTEDLAAYVGAETYTRSIQVKSDGSRFEPIIGKPGDGSSPHCAIADEFHEHDTPDQVDTMQTGMGAREQPLLLEITTAGSNLAGPCYDAHLEAKKVLGRALENEELFTIIYSIDEDEGDDWTHPSVLRKANPNFGISVDAEFLESQQRLATLNPIHQNRFKTKHLNVWCSARMAWMPLTQWHLCADTGLTEDDFKGQPCWFILDLASKDDLAVFGKLFKKRVNREDHYYWFARYYLPEDAVNNEDNVNAATYQKWARQGLLHLTDGAEIDFDVIKEDVLEARKHFAAREVLYDPWRATQLAHQLQKSGATIVELRQTVQNLSAPMKEVLSAVKGSRLHHDGNPVTTWMISNVTAKVDAKDNIYPRKEKPQMKIDGAVALIMGMARAMVVDKAGIGKWLAAGGSAQTEEVKA
jgi:phage terminase large subunit-like protein